MTKPVDMLRKIAGIIGAFPARALSQPVNKSAQSVAKTVPITFRLSGSKITESNGQIPPDIEAINDDTKACEGLKYFPTTIPYLICT